MNRFYVNFNNGTKSLTLEYNVLSTSIAERWYDELKNQISLNPTIKQPNRMYNFDNGTNVKTLVTELNSTIDVINQWKQIIPIKLSVPYCQQTFNELHKYFEIMREGILTPTDFWNESPPDIKSYIEDFNVLIHHLEVHGIDNHRYIVLTFNEKIPRKELHEEDYDQFTTKREFGVVYINYNEVGKQLFDVFRNKDKIVREDNIRPLRYYSPGMFLSFHDRVVDLEAFWKWWDNNTVLMEKLGFIKYNKKLSLGQIPVAKMTNISDRINELSQFTEINSIWI